MAVAVDAVSSAETQSASVTTATHTNLTIGASLSNGALIVGAGWDTKITAPNMHWDSTGTNQSMTLLGTIINTAGVEGTVALFGLRNPTSGNKTLSTSWTTASIVCLFGISFTGVDQTSDAAAFMHFNSATGNSAAPSVTITSATGNIIVGAFVPGSNTTDWTSVNNTTLCLVIGDMLAMNRAAGAASVAMSGVIPTDQWAAIGIDVAAAGAGGDSLLGNAQRMVFM